MLYPIKIGPIISWVKTLFVKKLSHPLITSKDAYFYRHFTYFYVLTQYFHGLCLAFLLPYFYRIFLQCMQCVDKQLGDIQTNNFQQIMHVSRFGCLKKKENLAKVICKCISFTKVRKRKQDFKIFKTKKLFLTKPRHHLCYHFSKIKMPTNVIQGLHLSSQLE